MAGILKALKLQGVSLLVALPGHDSNMYKSLRNLEGVAVLPLDQLNALEVLRPRRLLTTPAVLDAFRGKTAAGAT
jgi:large subunit ribosomal protein L4